MGVFERNAFRSRTCLFLASRSSLSLFERSKSLVGNSCEDPEEGNGEGGDGSRYGLEKFMLELLDILGLAIAIRARPAEDAWPEGLSGLIAPSTAGCSYCSGSSLVSEGEDIITVGGIIVFGPGGCETFEVEGAGGLEVSEVTCIPRLSSRRSDGVVTDRRAVSVAWGERKAVDRDSAPGDGGGLEGIKDAPSVAGTANGSAMSSPMPN